MKLSVSRTLVACVPMVVAAHLGAAHAAAAPAFTFPQYSSGAQVEAVCASMMDGFAQDEQRLQAIDPATVTPAFLTEMDALTRRYEDTAGPLDLLAGVHPDKSVRDAADACQLRYQAFSTRFQQNPKVYALLRQVKAADDIDARLLRDLLDVFEDSGVGLAPAAQARAQELTNEITRLSQDFERRVREEKTKLPFTAAELAGVPADVWKGTERDAQGRYLLGLDYPTHDPVMEHAKSSATRERMWRAFQQRGGTENLKTLQQLELLRREYAQLFGFESYADFVLRRRMAERAADVQTFLGTVKKAVAQRELNDLAMLRASKAGQSKRGARSATLDRWDLIYTINREKRARFKLDTEAFRQYFPPQASLEFVFRLATQLFGVQYEAREQTLWHPDVRVYDVRDIASQNVIGTLFVDLYPRADKYNHAAVWSFRTVSTLAQRRPAAGLVVNFNRKGLTIDELETLLHEFGHSLHSLLSSARYASQGGTNVQLDFVEAPSQMLEDWVYDPRVLALFQEVCASCKPVPAEMVRQAKKARDFAKGVTFARQHLYASYDLALYAKDAPEPMATWARMEGATPLGHVKGSMFPAAFSHIASNYAAGYYSYLWSLVIAEDLRTPFEADKLSGEVGRRYREAVLSQGGQVKPAEMLRTFLGRSSNSDAFFKSLNR